MRKHRYSPQEKPSTVLESLHIDVTKIVKCLSFTGFMITTVVMICGSVVKLAKLLKK